MLDGREVGFAGKRKMVKEIHIGPDSATVRFDFRNGETRSFTTTIGDPLFLQLAGHGAAQKIGDETAGVEDVDDMTVAVDDMIARLRAGEWGATRTAGDSFAGASVVIRAICEVTGKAVSDVKAFLQGKLDKAKAAGQRLTRNELYASFRRPGSKTAEVIARLEAEKAAKASSVDADELMAEMSGQ
jgi:hypothetical protein